MKMNINWTSNASYYTDASSTSTSNWISIYTWNNYPWDDFPEKLLQQHPSILLEDFLKMWEEFKLTLIDETKLEEGKTGRRYNVYSDEPYQNYGRHLGLVVVVDRENRVICHQVYNING